MGVSSSLIVFSDPCALVCTRFNKEFELKLELEPVIYTHVYTVEFYVKTAKNCQCQWLGTTDCKYMKNIPVDFIRIDACDKSPMQTTLYHLN